MSICATRRCRCWSCSLTPEEHAVRYRWKADEAKFAMPIEVGDAEHWTVVTPVTTEWKTMPWNGSKDDFEVATICIM